LERKSLEHTGAVRTAGERDVEIAAGTKMLPVLAGLRELLPGGGLRRGATVAVHTSSVLLALLAAASRNGSWCAGVGLPALSPVAAAEMGIALERLALVPHPGTEWTTIVAALLDGVDIVVAAPPGPVAPAVAGRLAARARRSEEHTSELQSQSNLVCRLLLEKKKSKTKTVRRARRT